MLLTVTRECAGCGAPLGGGESSLYCEATYSACKQAAYRRRKAIRDRRAAESHAQQARRVAAEMRATADRLEAAGFTDLAERARGAALKAEALA